MNGGTVIYVGNYELPDKNAAANRVVNNAKLFRSLGYNTVFLGVCRTGTYFTGIRKCGCSAEFDMYEQAYPRTTRQWLAEIFDTGNIRALADKYPDTDAIILYNTQYATLCAVKRYFARRGVRVLFDCTEWNAYTEGSFIKRPVKKWDSRLIEKRLPRIADGIIAVSKTMERRYGQQKPLILLPPLTDTHDAIWHQQPRKNDLFTFCYAGDPSDKDRLDVLLSAFAALPAGLAALKIIGISAEENAARSGAADGLPENVFFTGRLSHADTVKEILGCGCFIFLREPSRRNTAGFPTKFAEAYTCGVPVITTAISDVPDYASDNCTVLPDASKDGVLEAMRAVLTADIRPRALRESFDYRRYADDCRRWIERISCKED